MNNIINYADLVIAMILLICEVHLLYDMDYFKINFFTLYLGIHTWIYKCTNYKWKHKVFMCFAKISGLLIVYSFFVEPIKVLDRFVNVALLAFFFGQQIYSQEMHERSVDDYLLKMRSKQKVHAGILNLLDEGIMVFSKGGDTAVKYKNNALMKILNYPDESLSQSQAQHL